MLPRATPILGLHDIEWFSGNIWTGTVKILVDIQLTLMAAATIFNNSFVAGLAAETYFAVKLQLLGCKNI